MASTDLPYFGIDAELKAKTDEKYDVTKEEQAKEFLETVTGLSIGSEFQEGLKDGIILCTLLNKIRQNWIPKINTGKLAFHQMENIKNYIDGCQRLGLRAEDCFITSDLYEAKNMVVVVDNILDIKHKFGYAVTKD